MAGNLFRNLDMKLNEISSEPEVEGVVWGQKNGLAIASKGIDPHVAGYSSSLVKNAQTLQPELEVPIVYIEAEHSTYIFKSNGEYILSIKRRN